MLRIFLSASFLAIAGFNIAVFAQSGAPASSVIVLDCGDGRSGSGETILGEASYCHDAEDMQADVDAELIQRANTDARNSTIKNYACAGCPEGVSGCVTDKSHKRSDDHSSNSYNPADCTSSPGDDSQCPAGKVQTTISCTADFDWHFNCSDCDQ